jgi:hypothetical protein
MNFQDDIAQFVQDRGRVRMGQVSWWWASPSTVDLGNINLLDTACSANRKLPMDVRIWQLNFSSVKRAFRRHLRISWDPVG